jgi:ATP-dependent DNA helicase RecQ
VRGHDRLPTFGVGRELDDRQWKGVFRQLYALGLLWADPARGGALRAAEAARPVLKGEARLELREDALKPVKSKGPQPRALVAEADEPLFAALKAKRRELAEAQKVPAYVVFPDRVLIEIAARRPRTLDAMAEIGGVGAAKLQRYGRAFLEVIAGGAVAAPHPARARLATKPGAGALFDRLEAAARALARGEDGLAKPLTLGRPVLARVAEARPATLRQLAALPGMDAARVERFGDALLREVAAGED